MEYPIRKKSAYLDGYNDLKMLDELIIAGGGNKWKADWEETAKKPINDIADDRTRKGSMYTDSDILFKYSLREKGMEDTLFEDPTYLGFYLKFDTVASPLFNYGLGITNEFKSKSAVVNSSVLAFLDRYKTIPEINKRRPIYNNFIVMLRSIFNSTVPPEGSKQWTRSYYIEEIAGLDKLNEKMTKYSDKDGDKITITLSEDITLRSTYLSELYNNLCYSYKTQRYMIPENCLRFDLMIEVTDIRIFRYFSDGISYINNDPPRIIYKLCDCNFDFTKSMPFESTLGMGGYGGKGGGNPANLKFDIKYKSIEREFKSAMDTKIWKLNNKNADLGMSIATKEDVKSSSRLFHNGKFDNDIIAGEIISQKNLNNQSQSESIVNENDPSFAGFPLGTTVEGVKDTILQQLKETFQHEAKNYANKLIEKYNDIRGGLILGMIRAIRQPLQLPEIYPDNVYTDDFAGLSLKSFAKSLAARELNILQKEAQNKLLEITTIPKIK